MRLIKEFFIFVRWPITLGLIAALALLAFFPERVNWQPNPNPPAPASAQSNPAWQGAVSYADAVSKVSMGVVNVYTRKEVAQQLHPFFEDPVFKRLFNRADQPRQKRMQAALGSGVIVTREGHLLTNYHVIAGADEIVVALEDGRNAHALVLGENRERDLAVLKIDLPNLKPLTISPKRPRVGDVVLAIGNPYGVGQTVTMGVISATKSRNVDLNISAFEDFLQTDAAIHPGSSGGALIDPFGNLLGINTANLAQTGSGGIAFAVPIDIAMQTLSDIIQFGRVVRGWLGVEAEPLTPQLAVKAGLQSAAGIVITRTVAGGPAEKAGLLRGDIIIGIRGNPVNDPIDIVQTIKESRPGDIVTIEYVRNGIVASQKVTLQEQPVQAQAVQEQPSQSEPAQNSPTSGSPAP